MRALHYLFLAASAAFAQLPQPPADFEARADALVKSYVAAGQFQGTVFVKSKDNILFERSYGRANAEWGNQFSAKTRFRIASLTKAFTAVAILQLEEKGLLSVSDPINKYYPEAPREWAPITIDHILHHTSGIANYNDATGFDYRKPLTPAEAVASVHAIQLAFTPGTQYKYANTGYVLAGLIIERVTKMSYESYLKENIINRIGLENTGYDRTDLVFPERASGYTGDGLRLRNASFIDMSIPFSAWGLYSTVDDLRRWIDALENGTLISPASFRRMTTPGLNGYGYGVVAGKAFGTDFYFHDGGIPGFSVSYGRFPAERLTFIVFSNLWASKVNEINDGLFGIFLGDTPPPAQVLNTITWETNELRAVAGTYKIPNGGKVTIALDDDGLILTDSRRPGFLVPLYPQSTGTLTARIFSASLFTVKDAGLVTRIRYQLDGEEVVLERVDESTSPTLPKSISGSKPKPIGARGFSRLSVQ